MPASRTSRRSTRPTISGRYSEDSARWAYDFVEKLALLRWQPALKDVEAARAPLEDAFFADQAAVEAKAAALLKTDPAAAAKYLTELTVSRMEKLVALYRITHETPHQVHRRRRLTEAAVRRRSRRRYLSGHGGPGPIQRPKPLTFL